MVKVISVSVQKGQPLQLPQEAVEALGDVDEVHFIVDADKRTVTVQAEHPRLAHNAAIMDEMAKLNAGHWEEDYSQPVPESFLQRRGKAKKGDE